MSEYLLIPTVVFHKAESGQLHAKRIYCQCGELLHGEHLNVVMFNFQSYTYKYDTLENPYLVYDCPRCGFHVDGEDATALRKAFIEKHLQRI